MGVYIKMKMPRSCYECRFNNGFGVCYALKEGDDEYIFNENTDAKRHSKCPLVPLALVKCGECIYWKDSQYFSGEKVCTYASFHTFHKWSFQYCDHGTRAEEGETNKEECEK